jgi:hypothetical protein
VWNISRRLLHALNSRADRSALAVALVDDAVTLLGQNIQSTFDQIAGAISFGGGGGGGGGS